MAKAQDHAGREHFKLHVPIPHFLLRTEGWVWNEEEGMTHLKTATETANGKPWAEPGKQQTLNKCVPYRQVKWSVIAYNNL